MNTELQSFIEHARKKGMDHATIRMLLLSAGWKEKDIAEALTEQALDMPVPVPTDTGGARDAFFHLLTFVALYTSVISLIILFFTYINRLFPDAATQSPYADMADFSTIRWSIAAVIVAYPLFVWISRILLREMQEHVEKAASGVRRWLTYLTLFVAASTLMGDVITLVFTLLNGELSTRFVLKVIVILLLAGCTFTYYFYALRMTPLAAKQSGLNKTYGWVSCAIVLVALIWGIVITGSPMSARKQQFDERRVEDLRGIANEISVIVYGNVPKGMPNSVPVNPLPATLEDAARQAVFNKLNITDPETSTPYRYTVNDPMHYQLCAVFNAMRDQAYDIFWNHPAGQHCFDIDVTKNLP